MSARATSTRPGQPIGTPSVPSLRDIGGYQKSRGAQVRMEILYRSVELNAERSAEPDVVPEGSVLVVCDVLEGSQSEAPAELTKVLADPSLAEQILGDGRAVARLRVTGTRRTPLPGGKRSDPE